jgi:hypothetical protein
VLLAAGAVTESVARAVITGASAQVALAFCLVRLGTTLPPAFLRPAAAAVTVSVASVLSAALFHTLTIAGFGAQLIVLYRVGWSSSSRHAGQIAAAGLAVPFLVLALVESRPPGSEVAVLTMLLASLGPAAVWVGIARRARSEALADSAAR